MDNRNIGGGRIMTSWAERMHRGAASLGTVVTSCGHPQVPYPLRIEKVKFGVPLEEVCKNDIPGPLLILILKLNKEGPCKKDIFRAPGHQGNMRKLNHFLQSGRLVNIDNYSVYTIASVLKKFLRKIPDGIFGKEGEAELFRVIEMTNIEDQRESIQRLISSLPINTQRLIVLLFGTFRVIASNCERAQTGMTSEALGVSVAPSFFQSCVSDGKQAKMEDVLKFKVATKIMKFLIDNFGVSNLFGRENYEYYARISGRILRVEEDWIFSFRYPPDALVSTMSQKEDCQSTPALMQALDRLESETAEASSSLGSIPENNLLESYTRLSISLEDNGLYNSVPERQAARMKMRSEWFLSPIVPSAASSLPDHDSSFFVLREDTGGNLDASGQSSLNASEESPKHHTLLRRSSSKDKDRGHRLVRRTSSKKNKENGTSPSGSLGRRGGGQGTDGGSESGNNTMTSTGGGSSNPASPSSNTSTGPLSPYNKGTPQNEEAFLPSQADCTETDIQTFHVTLTYKPRI